MEVRAPLGSEISAIRDLLAANGWAHRIPNLAWFQDLLARSTALVGVDEGHVVGFARAVTDGLSNGYLSMVVVADSHRRRGLGSRLVREIIGPEAGMTWALRADRPGARQFFESLGFSISESAMERNRDQRMGT